MMNEKSRNDTRGQCGWCIAPIGLFLRDRTEQLGLDKEYVLQIVSNSMQYAGKEIDGRLWARISKTTAMATNNTTYERG